MSIAQFAPDFYESQRVQLQASIREGLISGLVDQAIEAITPDIRTRVTGFVDGMHPHLVAYSRHETNQLVLQAVFQVAGKAVTE